MEVIIKREVTPIELLEQFSKEYGADFNKAKAIVHCESGVYHSDPNVIEEYQRTIPNLAGASSASGYAQFLDGTWENTMIRMGTSTTISKHHPVMSLKAFVWLLATDGDSHWNESKACWSNLIKYD